MSLRTDLKNLMEYNYYDELKDFKNRECDSLPFDYGDEELQELALKSNHPYGIISRIMKEMDFTHGW